MQIYGTHEDTLGAAENFPCGKREKISWTPLHYAVLAIDKMGENNVHTKPHGREGYGRNVSTVIIMTSFLFIKTEAQWSGALLPSSTLILYNHMVTEK